MMCVRTRNHETPWRLRTGTKGSTRQSTFPWLQIKGKAQNQKLSENAPKYIKE